MLKIFLVVLLLYHGRMEEWYNCLHLSVYNCYLMDYNFSSIYSSAQIEKTYSLESKKEL